MNANLHKLIGSAAVVLAMSSSAFAQTYNKSKACPCPPFEQGMPLTNCETFPPAYNAPARIDVKCSWDVFLTGSFIYWDMEQEGMETCYNSAIVGGTLVAPINGLMVSQTGRFQPGFKVGIGCDFDYDAWVGYVEYTWLHGSQTAHYTAPADSSGTGVLVLSGWFTPDYLSSSPTNYTASTLNTKWNVNLDMLDATLSRPYYQGRSLTLTPFAGARAAWIRQSFRLDAQPTNIATHAFSHNKSHNWGLGPLAGVLGHWLMGCGFRLEGDVGASLLFTRFTKVTNRQDTIDATNPSTLLRMRNYNTLCPTADMGLGIGWGSYFDCQNFYLDIAANYDFIYMWGQNRMQALQDAYERAQAPAGALTYNGLTLTVRLDF